MYSLMGCDGCDPRNLTTACSSSKSESGEGERGEEVSDALIYQPRNEGRGGGIYVFESRSALVWGLVQSRAALLVAVWAG
jgi:hypothetical protein